METITTPTTIKEVQERRQAYSDAAGKHISMQTQCMGATRTVPGLSEAREEHYRTSDEYSDALKSLPPGLIEEIDGVTYETVQMSGAVFGEYVVIRTVE